MDLHHRISAERIAIDSQAVEGSRKCSRCGRAKPLKAFYWVKATSKPHSWCRMCVRLTAGLYRECPETRGKPPPYRRRPGVRERMRRINGGRGEYPREYNREYSQTDRGRIIKARIAAKQRLMAATTDERRRVAQACIDRHTAALAALDAEDE